MGIRAGAQRVSVVELTRRWRAPTPFATAGHTAAASASTRAVRVDMEAAHGWDAGAMMNAIWTALVVASVMTAAFSGTMAEVSKASVESAKAAVTLAVGLIGVMAFWLGLMRVVQEAGFLAVLARWLRPVMVRLFPDVPPEHPAMSAMIMNIASNMLGLGNAATPFGIKAMHELNRLNPRPGVATDAMVLFLAINTSSVAMAPLGVIATRAALGSSDAAGIWLPTLMATSLSTAVAILTAKALQRVVPPVTAYAARAGDVTLPPAVAAAEPVAPEQRSTRPLGCGVALGVTAALALGLVLHLQSGLASGETAAALVRDSLSSWVLPILIVTMLLYGMAKGVPVYDTMIAGAREGFEVAVRIIPFLVAIVVAAGMFRASGLLDLVVRGLGPFTDPLGFPPQALPMALLRPLSGSGAYAIMAETMQAEGPDSRVGYLVSVLQGSSETTFYVLAVYFGAVAVTRVRHALAAGLLADVAAVVWSVLAVNWYVGN